MTLNAENRTIRTFFNLPDFFHLPTVAIYKFSEEYELNEYFEPQGESPIDLNFLISHAK